MVNAIRQRKGDPLDKKSRPDRGRKDDPPGVIPYPKKGSKKKVRQKKDPVLEASQQGAGGTPYIDEYIRYHGRRSSDEFLSRQDTPFLEVSDSGPDTSRAPPEDGEGQQAPPEDGDGDESVVLVLSDEDKRQADLRELRRQQAALKDQIDEMDADTQAALAADIADMDTRTREEATRKENDRVDALDRLRMEETNRVARQQLSDDKDARERDSRRVLEKEKRDRLLREEESRDAGGAGTSHPSRSSTPRPAAAADVDMSPRTEGPAAADDVPRIPMPEAPAAADDVPRSTRKKKKTSGGGHKKTKKSKKSKKKRRRSPTPPPSSSSSSSSSSSASSTTSSGSDSDDSHDASRGGSHSSRKRRHHGKSDRKTGSKSRGNRSSRSRSKSAGRHDTRHDGSRSRSPGPKTPSKSQRALSTSASMPSPVPVRVTRAVAKSSSATKGDTRSPATKSDTRSPAKAKLFAFPKARSSCHKELFTEEVDEQASTVGLNVLFRVLSSTVSYHRLVSITRPFTGISEPTASQPGAIQSAAS
jgi:hypothetical protein